MHAFRSPFRLFIVGVVGIVLLVAALDIMFFHWLSVPPEGSPGALSTRGQAQQRGDIIWGATFVGVGVLLLGWALGELFKRKPVVDVRDDGLYAQIGANQPEVLIPWIDIASVSSTVTTDPYDGSEREQLVVEIADPSHIPASMAGARWEGSKLFIDAHDWSRAVTEIALAAQGAREAALRSTRASVGNTSPSMMWETSVDVPPTDEEE
ncbi:MAG: hypothetical protein KDB69_06370 [Acidimicrobiia bacterium]|nr:hypothetical protein [Acidimicrobiia bacterium]